MGPVNPKWGVFLDPVDVRYIRDETKVDRQMLLLANVRFMRRTGDLFTARKGLVFDGASIPKRLWSLVGSPFDGDYRDAAVIHDQGCKDGREGTSQVDSPEVHQIFREAMLALGVPTWKAYMMWAAVRIGGPHFKKGKSNGG